MSEALVPNEGANTLSYPPPIILSNDVISWIGDASQSILESDSRRFLELYNSMTIDDDCIYTRLNGTWIELAIRGNRVMQAGESGYIDLPGLSRRSQELLVYKMRTMIDGK